RDRRRQLLVGRLLVAGERNADQREVEGRDHVIGEGALVPEPVDDSTEVRVQLGYLRIVRPGVRRGEPQTVVETLTEGADERRCGVAVALIRDEEAGLVVRQQCATRSGVDDRDE